MCIRSSESNKDVNEIHIIHQAWDQDGWILAKSSFCIFMHQDLVQVQKNQKNKKKEWGFTLIRIKNDLLIFILFFNFVFFGFCSIITSWQSFTFPLFWQSSAPFCSSIAQINQKLQTTGMEVCTTQLFFKHRNKAGNPKRAR